MQSTYKLSRVNNKILKILRNQPVLTPISELYTAYNTLPIAEWHRQQIFILAQKALGHSDKLPEVFSNRIFSYTRIYMNIILDEKIAYTCLVPNCLLERDMSKKKSWCCME
jgi:hypothetical protein